MRRSRGEHDIRINRFSAWPPFLCVSASKSWPLVILPSEVGALALPFPLFPLSRFSPLLFRAEAALFVAADAAVRVEAFQYEFRGGRPHRIRLIRAQAQVFHLLHQALNAAEL